MVLHLVTFAVGAGIGRGCMMQNILLKRHIAAVHSVYIVLYGASGAGFSREWVRYCAAWAAASADDMRGIGNLRGKNSIVSLICVDLFLSI